MKPRKTTPMQQSEMQTSDIGGIAGSDSVPPPWLGLEGFEEQTQAWLSKHSSAAESQINEEGIEEAEAKYAHWFKILELINHLVVRFLTSYTWNLVEGGAVIDQRVVDAAKKVVSRAKGKGKQDMDVDASQFYADQYLEWQKSAPIGTVRIVEIILRLVYYFYDATERLGIEIEKDLVEAARRIIMVAERMGPATVEEKSSAFETLTEVIVGQEKRHETSSKELLIEVSISSGIPVDWILDTMKWFGEAAPTAKPDQTRNIWRQVRMEPRNQAAPPAEKRESAANKQTRGNADVRVRHCYDQMDDSGDHGLFWRGMEGFEEHTGD